MTKLENAQKTLKDVIAYKRLSKQNKRKHWVKQLVEILYLFKYDTSKRERFLNVLTAMKESGLFDCRFLILQTVKYERIFCSDCSGQLSRFLRARKDVPVLDFKDLRHFSIVELQKLLEELKWR